MNSSEIRPFIPARDLSESKDFYRTLGFTCDDATEQLTLVMNGACTFFLYQEDTLNQNDSKMFQLIVPDLDAVLASIQGVKDKRIRYEPIKNERWGRVLYLWGPSNEMWHITELSQ